MLALDDDDDALHVQLLHERVGDLGGEALLDLRATREQVDEAGDLGQAGDAAVLAGMYPTWATPWNGTRWCSQVL